MIARMKKALARPPREGEDRARSPNCAAWELVHLEPVAGSGESFDRRRPTRLVSRNPWRPCLLSAGRTIQRGRSPSMRDAPSPGGSSPVGSKSKAPDRAANLGAEIDRLRPWGDFDPAVIRALAAGRTHPAFSEVPTKRIERRRIRRSNISVSGRESVVRSPRVRATAVPAIPQAFIERPPPSPLSSPGNRARSGSGAADRGAAEMSGRLPGDRRPAKTPAVAIDRISLRDRPGIGLPGRGAGMPCQAPRPGRRLGAPDRLAKSRGWAFCADDPSGDDIVPTKIQKIPRSSAWSNPIFDFLGTAPGYREYDISGWFLFFFALFFAMIFGDGGYGSLLMLRGWGPPPKRGPPERPSRPRPAPALPFRIALLWGIVDRRAGSVPARARFRRFCGRSLSPGSPTPTLCPAKISRSFASSSGWSSWSIARIKKHQARPRSTSNSSLSWVPWRCFRDVFSGPQSRRRRRAFPVPGLCALADCRRVRRRILFSRPILGPKVFHALGEACSAVSGISSPSFWTCQCFRRHRLLYPSLGGRFGRILPRRDINTMGGSWGTCPSVLLGCPDRLRPALNLVLSVLAVVVHGIRLNMLEFSGHLGMEWSGINTTRSGSLLSPNATPKGEKHGISDNRSRRRPRAFGSRVGHRSGIAGQAAIGAWKRNYLQTSRRPSFWSLSPAPR